MVDTEVCRPILERTTHSGEDGVLLPEWVFMSDVVGSNGFLYRCL
ncbi:hypothetical protein HMPREF1553_00557 [Porphyromonas gingivalis F0568]|nr:hypothetical protein HMPREF1553_00557 [Porphyromonas gingivalis F0568]